MRTHAVKGLVKCHEHDTYVIICHCPVEAPETIKARFKRFGVKTEPTKVWLDHVR